MDKSVLEGLRKQYTFKELKEGEILTDPFKQFEVWLKESIELNLVDSNAMFLATCSAEGRPSIRTVLLKGFDEKGFMFYTNYHSRKGMELDFNRYASLLFFWRELERQVRIEGVTEKVSREESEHYFHSRPFESQIAAIASKQSGILESREMLVKNYEELKKKYEGKTVPLPDYWGGYRVIPDCIEFWQGRENRLHDRIKFTLLDGQWKIDRLSP